jgi:hypothetical protein
MAFALRVFWTAGDRSVTSEFHTEWAGTTVPYPTKTSKTLIVIRYVMRKVKVLLDNNTVL